MHGYEIAQHVVARHERNIFQTKRVEDVLLTVVAEFHAGVSLNEDANPVMASLDARLVQHSYQFLSYVILNRQTRYQAG